jgi:hypothetical protein
MSQLMAEHVGGDLGDVVPRCIGLALDRPGKQRDPVRMIGRLVLFP